MSAHLTVPCTGCKHTGRRVQTSVIRIGPEYGRVWASYDQFDRRGHTMYMYLVPRP